MSSAITDEAASAAPAIAEINGILDTIDVPTVVVGADCRVERFNRAAAEVFGFTPSDIGQHPSNLAALTDAKGLQKLCAQVLADGASCRRDICNGDRWFVLRIAPYTGSDGHIRAAVLTFTNVTGFRASIGQAIYEREYAKTILNTVEPLVVLDAALRVQTANRRFYELFGVSRESTQGASLPDLGNDDWKGSAFWASLEAIVSHNREFETVEVERAFPGIGRRMLLLDARPLSRDGNSLILLVLRDVTERKRAEENLRRSEERFRSLVSLITDIPWTTDPDGMFAHPQIAWEAYTGQSWEQHRGFGWVEALHPDDREALKTLWFNARKSCTMYKAAGRLWHTGTERYRYFLARAIPLFNPDGSVREWVGSCTDIDDQQRAAEKLEQTVAERTAKLRDTVNELESYSYSISHDMRAPLRAMQAYAQVLVDELGPSLDEHHRRYLGRITAASNRLDKLITDVLSYSRLARGEIVLMPVSLDKLIEDITYQYPALQNAEIKIADDLGTVIAAEALLTQAIANLLTNAAKFVARGVKPQIRVWSEPSVLSGKSAVKLLIQDNGIGIALENQQRIFGIFNRVNSEKDYEGTGIGLSIVKKAIERMNGEVAVISELGHGSTFWLQLAKA